MKFLTHSLRRVQRTQAIILAALFPGLALMPGAGRANPSGGVVVNGALEIGDGLNGHLLINQLSDKAIINWQDFSIGAGEITQFVQPGSGSATLNRVVSGNPSAIHGALQANGKIFVINPNGIMVGPSGTIDVAGLALSTLDVSDAEFLAGGDMVFRGTSGAGVQNFGRINAIGGDVFLIGKSVTNGGSITASGTVGMAAGEEVLITAAPDANGERVFVKPVGSGGVSNGVTNTGSITGSAVELKAHGNLYALAINNSGSIRATGASASGGRVFLRAPGGRVDNSGSIAATIPGGNGGRILIEGAIVNAGGTIDASSTNKQGAGGEVTLLGQEINVPNGARIAADGGTGGLVKIGGGLGEVQASSINIASGASVSANGSSGAGGTVAIAGGLKSAISVGGNVSATGADGFGGGVISVNGANVVVAATGALDASGGEGGNVGLNGEQIVRLDGAVTGMGAAGDGGVFSANSKGDVLIGDTGRINTGGETGGGRIELQSGTNSQVRISGNLEADGNTGDGGVIEALGGSSVRLADGASVQAVGGTSGGRVRISADSAVVEENTVIDASGGTNGGSVFVGGGFQGKDSSIRNASVTTVASGSVIAADGRNIDSRGGQVVIWADRDTYFGGSISASGGETGGFIEVSGKENLLFEGLVDTMAANGNAGTLLIDPADVIIGTTITAATLQTALGSSNVVIYTDPGAAGSGDITINQAVTWSNANSLTFLAFRDVNVNANVTNTAASGGGALSLIAGWNGTTNSPSASPAPTGIANPPGANSALTGANFIATPASFGNNSGDVVIGNGTQTSGINVGSRTGTTWVLGDTVNLNASASGTNRYAQIGSRDTATTGAIEVHAKTGVSVLAANNSGSFAQIGHGGFSSAAGNRSGNINVQIVNGGATLTGAGVQGYAQIGNGGFNVDGVMGGSTTVNAAGAVLLTGGANTEAYVQIGHGGSGSDGNKTGDITVIADSLLVSTGTGIASNAQIGLGGGMGQTGSDFSVGTLNGTVSVTTDVGGITLTSAPGNTQSYAQIGNGGLVADGTKTGTTTVNSAGDVVMIGGSNANTYVQIGSGGSGADGVQNGVDVSVTALSLTMTGGSGVSAYNQIGSGGGVTNGNNAGIGTVNGSVTVSTSGAAGISASGGLGSNAYAQIGNGGALYGVGDAVSGAVTVSTANSGNLMMNAGLGQFSYVQVGHGGADDTASSFSMNLAGQVLVDVAGDLTMVSGNGGSGAYSQIGLGGSLSGGSKSGDVIVTAQSATLQSGLTSNSHSQIGNGGSTSFGAITSNVTLITAGDISLTSANGNNAYTMVGGGGSNSAIGFSVTGDVSATSSAGNISLQAGRLNGFSLIGNGGSGYEGSKTGNVAVEAAGDVTLQAGTLNGAFAQIGLAGAGTSSPVLGLAANTVDVVAGGNVTLTGSPIGGTGAGAMIGNGGTLAVTTSISGDVSVDAGGDVILMGGAANTSVAQIGNGGAGASGAKTGDIFVTAADNVEITAGSGSNSYAKIGNGDRMFDTAGAGGGTGSVGGNIDVQAGNDIALTAGMIGGIDPLLTNAASSTGGDTFIAVSRDDPTAPGVGILSGDTDSALVSGPGAGDQLRLYLPTRASNQLVGTELNGYTYPSAYAEPFNQQLDEFTIHQVNAANVEVATPGEHANLVGGNTAAPDTAAYSPAFGNYSLYYDTITVVTAGPPVPPSGGGGGDPGGGGDTGAGGGGVVPDPVPVPTIIGTDANGQPIIVLAVPGQELGLFITTADGVVGFAPGRLGVGSPFTPVGPFIDVLLDNRFYDDQHGLIAEYGRQGDPIFRDLEAGFTIDYEPRRYGLSSFDLFGDGGQAGIYILPPDGSQDDDIRRWLESQQRQLGGRNFSAEPGVVP